MSRRVVRDRTPLDKWYVTVCNQASTIRSYVIGEAALDRI